MPREAVGARLPVHRLLTCSQPTICTHEGILMSNILCFSKMAAFLSVGFRIVGSEKEGLEDKHARQSL